MFAYMKLQVSVESPRGLRAVLKSVYSSPPISEKEFYTPRPSLDAEDIDEEGGQSIDKGLGIRIQQHITYI